MTWPTEDPTNPAQRPLRRIGLTVEEAADMLGISRAFAYGLVADGTLPSLRLRRRIVVPLAPLLQMFDADASDDDEAAPTAWPDVAALAADQGPQAARRLEAHTEDKARAEAVPRELPGEDDRERELQ